MLLLLAAGAGAMIEFGWRTVPSQRDLLASVGAHSMRQDRLEAANALVGRGYFDGMSPAEFDAWLEERPADVRAFIRHMHPDVTRRIERRARTKAE